MKSPQITKNITIFLKLLRASLGSSQVIFPSKTAVLMKTLLQISWDWIGAALG